MCVCACVRARSRSLARCVFNVVQRGAYATERRGLLKCEPVAAALL